jgi:putative transposase
MTNGMRTGTGAALWVGDRIRFDGQLHTVVGLSGTIVRLADADGQTWVIHLPHLLADPTFEPAGQRESGPVLPAGLLNGLPQQAVEAAKWWERQLVEVLTGLPPDAPPEARPRPEFDPATSTLEQREQAKAKELSALGRQGVGAWTIRRKRQRYQAQGLAGLVDWRTDRKRPIQGRIDPRVLEALRQAIEEATERSTRTAGYFYWRVQQLLTAQHGAGTVPMPSRATFYRLFDRLSQGRHTTGSARTRRSLANRPDGPYGELVACRPGELVEIDSTPLDVLVLLDKGVPGRVELTGTVDLATRSIPAAVLRPTTKSVDAALLLARTATPEPMRPGWAEALRMSDSVLPHRRLLALDQRLEHAAARPLIMPETIVCDHGKAFLSQNFRSACHKLGINVQPTHPRTPTENPHIERTLQSVATLFAQFVAGYVGRSAEFRGRKADGERLWSLLELQELLDAWIVVHWQNRAHDGLRDPVAPGRAFTPKEKYAALVEAAGYVPVALSAVDYVELLPLPARWQAINTYGVKLNYRTYDSVDLNPFRRQPSGVRAKKNRWQVHHDPYDVSRIWVRNHWDGGWIMCYWKHLHRVPVPFGELAWNHARQELIDQGEQPTETAITDAVAALFYTASRGPVPAGDPQRTPSKKAPSKRRRVVARTHATAPARPEPAATGVRDAGSAGRHRQRAGSDPPAAVVPADGDEPDDAGSAEVVPLPIFNAREEAAKWW